MSDIVKKLKELGDKNHLDMSGRHTIAECLNAFGGKDRREISKALKGAVYPIAAPILAFNAVGAQQIMNKDHGYIDLFFSYGESSLKLKGNLPENDTLTHSFKDVCSATLRSNHFYRFTSDIPVSGVNKGFLLCNKSSNAIVAYANSEHGANFGFIDTDVDVYLKIDIDGPIDFGNETVYNFKLVETV